MNNDALSIQELAEATGVSVHGLRYYEKAGLMIEVPRRANGHRLYFEQHVRWVRFLRRLRNAGMSIGRVRQYAELAQRGDATLVARAELLTAHKHDVAEKIRHLSEHHDLIEAKLVRYREQGIGCDSSE